MGRDAFLMEILLNWKPANDHKKIDNSPAMLCRVLVEGYHASQNARTTLMLRLYMYKEIFTTPNK